MSEAGEIHRSEHEDSLKLASNTAVTKMLQKHAANGSPPEVVHFSDFLVKINRKSKQQMRVMLVTNKAVYNLLPNDMGKCKRRIELKNIGSVSVSQVSNEFVLHVPDEYDYRFTSSKKTRIAELIGELYKDLVKKALPISYPDQGDLTDVVVTKPQAKLMSREERMKRRRELVSQAHESDEEDTAAAGEGDTTQLLASGERASLEDFEFLKVIGRGSFGKVMQVQKKDTKKVYAMKILKKDAIVARNQVEHTRAERKILEALQHPFLMGLRFAFQTKGKLYFVLDYYRGGELFFHLKQQRRFTEDAARLFVAEVGAALGHLHSLDVIYRDLKPENILLDHDGHLCLTDFGLSKEVTDDGEAHTFCGTPEYLAPEIVMGCGHGKAVDWWSLGILLYELTVGIPPFYSQNVNEMYSKIQHGVLRFPPFLSDPCKSLIIALLNRDPEERLGSGATDFEELKAHPFFSAIDWAKLMRKEVEPIYKPKAAQDDETDASLFDDVFTKEVPKDTYVEASAISEADAGQFNGFTFAPEAKLMM